MAKQPPKDRRPAKARGTPRAPTLIIGSLLVAVVLVIIAKVGREGDQRESEYYSDDVIELIPEPLTDYGGSGKRLDFQATIDPPSLDAGGWINIFDPQSGRLAQRHRFDRLDPSPPGLPAQWAKITRPRAEIFSSNDRILRVAGNSALVHLPHRVLESGTLTGNVTLSLFDSDPPDDLPSMVVRTHEAEFDNFMAAVRCKDVFEIEWSAGELKGRGLALLFDEKEEWVRITVDHVDYVRLASAQEAAVTRTTAAVPPPTATVPAARRLDHDPVPRAAAPENGSAPHAASASEGKAQFYKLTLHDNVVIRLGEAADAQTATGDTLTIVFSPRSRTRTGPVTIRQAPRPALGISAALAAMAVATYGPPSLARGTGPQEPVQTPASSSAQGVERLAPLPRADDIHITLTGGLTVVPIIDPAQRLASDADARLELQGSPVRLRDPPKQTDAECDRLVYHTLEKKVQLLGSPGYPLSVRTPQLLAGGGALWFKPDEDVGGFDGPGWLRLEPDSEAAPDQLRIAWRGGVDLAFTGDTATPANNLHLRQATFRGGVDMTRQESGGRSRLWADRVGVWLGLPPLAPADQEIGDTTTTTSQIERFLAEGNVQATMADGARVFAERMSSEVATERIEIAGPDVAIAYDHWWLDKGRIVIVNNRTRSVFWDGPGRARRFDLLLQSPGPGRINRPLMETPAQLQADWNESMRYDDTTPETAGEIELVGAVAVYWTPLPLVQRRINARFVTLHLVEPPDGEIAGAPDADNLLSGRSSRRAIGRLIARGDARLESRHWLNEDLSGKPSVFFLAGEHVEYDQETGEGRVPGAGELLIRNLDPAGSAPRATGSPFGRRGTTWFGWQEGLTMTRSDQRRFLIVMRKQVEMRHLGPEGAKSTLACEWLEALVDGIERPGSQAPDVAAATGAGPVAPAQLRRVRANGAVFFRTPDRDVDCDYFEYDADDGVATLEAAAGGLATIYARGQPEPVRFGRARWDTRTDTLEIERGRGGGGR